MISLEKALELKYVDVNVGEKMLELHCDIVGSPPTPILWKKYDTDLSIPNKYYYYNHHFQGRNDHQDRAKIKVTGNGTLLFYEIEMEDAGNYSCTAPRNHEVVQTLILRVFQCRHKLC